MARAITKRVDLVEVQCALEDIRGIIGRKDYDPDTLDSLQRTCDELVRLREKIRAAIVVAEWEPK
jgi:hypothetical protein